MIDELKQNIDTELRMLTEISQYVQRMEVTSGTEQKLLAQAVDALRNGIKIVNDSVPGLLAQVPIAPKLPTTHLGKEPQPNLPAVTPVLKQVKFRSADAEIAVTLQEKDREAFLRELSITDSIIKKIKIKPTLSFDKAEEFQAARGYLKTSNRFFQTTAMNLINKGYFKSVSIDLRKANLDILFTTYIAMVLFTTFISIFAGLVLGVLYFFLGIDFDSATIIVPSTISALRAAKALLFPIIVPIITFLLLLYYPSTEKDSLAKKIDRELPFAVIHMSAVSGSGIEPTQIFRIIGTSREYPALKTEIRKVLNQINLYGYDLVASLSLVARTTPSTKLAELFSGLATTITSGGSLSDFFEKRAETLLISYRLEREKYTKVAETFMDIYISLVIAAPMILMIILVIVSVSQLNTGLSPLEMTLVIIFIIGVLNALFIGFLHFKQPIY